MKPKVGIYINNRTTAGLCRQFLGDAHELPFEPLILARSKAYQEAVCGDQFGDCEFRFIGCDYPWRTRKKHGAHTLYYLLSDRELRRNEAFEGLQALLVFKDDSGLDRLLVIRARQKSIPVICVQEEAIYEGRTRREPTGLSKLRVYLQRTIEHWIDPQLPVGGPHEKGLLADLCICYGSKKVERLVSAGYPAEQAVALGHPAYDDLIYSDAVPEACPREIYFAHQQTFDKLVNEFDWYAGLVAGAKAANARLIFKLHPRSKRKKEDLLRHFGKDADCFEVRDTGDVQAQRLESGLFVTGDSAAVNRALADGVVPLLLNGANPGGRYLDLAEKGAALAVNQAAELPGLIEQFFASPSLREKCLSQRASALKSHLGEINGGASKRYQKAIMTVATSA